MIKISFILLISDNYFDTRTYLWCHASSANVFIYIYIYIFSCVIQNCERTAGNHSFLLGPQGLNANMWISHVTEVKMKLSRLKCVSSLCSGHPTVFQRWNANRKLSRSSSARCSANSPCCSHGFLTAIAP